MPEEKAVSVVADMIDDTFGLDDNPNMQQIRKSQAAVLYLAGVNPEEIAKRLGLCIATIHKYIKSPEFIKLLSRYGTDDLTTARDILRPHITTALQRVVDDLEHDNAKVAHKAIDTFSKIIGFYDKDKGTASGKEQYSLMMNDILGVEIDTNLMGMVDNTKPQYIPGQEVEAIAETPSEEATEISKEDDLEEEVAEGQVDTEPPSELPEITKLILNDCDDEVEDEYDEDDPF